MRLGQVRVLRPHVRVVMVGVAEAARVLVELVHYLVPRGVLVEQLVHAHCVLHALARRLRLRAQTEVGYLRQADGTCTASERRAATAPHGVVRVDQQ